VRRQILYFSAPYTVDIRDQDLQDPGPGELLVQTSFSAISPGTELMIYRGQAPEELSADESITALTGSLNFPLKYGYAAVGQVVDAGKGFNQDWIGKNVFSFQPHQTHFIATPEEVFLLPPDISLQAAVFLPNMETAVNLVMDGRPMIGERVAVFGQGIIGLLTTALLDRFPLKDLITLDLFSNRRVASREAGATQSFDPDGDDCQLSVRGTDGIDLAYEISGSPNALDQAIAVTGFGGRVVIGSWYGEKPANLNLGGAFHRSRIQLIASQVSTIKPSLLGRWDKSRRFDLTWDLIRKVKPERWITHELPFLEASKGYDLLDRHPEEAIQVLFNYT
jgi:2-desacetyl-2-hydroxyethyl bacteriochlorophyllide A dehydrogenase